MVSPEILERKFREVGVPLHLVADRSWFTITVGRNRTGEWITLSPGDAEVVVMDADREHHQLLLLAKTSDAYGGRTKQKILCGQDERSLFTVAVPGLGGAAVNTVAAAHEALKPAEIRTAESREATRRRPRRRGRGLAFVRQGDWFFVPHPDLPLDLPGARKRVHLGRGGGNSHVVDYLRGDERQFYSQFARSFGSGPVYARGFVRHREHRPIHLRCWHEVFPNTAIRAPGGYND